MVLSQLAQEHVLEVLLHLEQDLVPVELHLKHCRLDLEVLVDTSKNEQTVAVLLGLITGGPTLPSRVFKHLSWHDTGSELGAHHLETVALRFHSSPEQPVKLK